MRSLRALDFFEIPVKKLPPGSVIRNGTQGVWHPGKDGGAEDVGVWQRPKVFRVVSCGVVHLLGPNLWDKGPRVENDSGFSGQMGKLVGGEGPLDLACPDLANFIFRTLTARGQNQRMMARGFLHPWPAAHRRKFGAQC